MNISDPLRQGCDTGIRNRSTLLTLLVVTSYFGCAGPKTISECVLVQPQYERRVLRDFQYAHNRVFDLARVGDSVYWQSGDSIIALRFYHVTDSGHAGSPPAIVYVDWMNCRVNTDSVLGVASRGFDLTVDPLSFHVICPEWFDSHHTQVVGYYMAVKTPTGVREFGDTNSTPIRLQMLKPKKLDAAHPLWDAEWKNAYDLGVGDFMAKHFYVGVRKALFGDEEFSYPNSEKGRRYETILGLDLRNPDTTFANYGLLVFPSRYPFADTSLSEPVSAIYESSDLPILVVESKYYLTTSVRHQPMQVSLSRINLKEESERVYWQGALLARGIDYEIDYTSGVLTALKDELLEGTLQICYKYLASDMIRK